VLLFNNRKQSGALFFSTFHLAGETPQNKWQGKRALFINEGWYVSIRELQLYGEFSEGSLLWKHTRRKINEIENTFLNRNNR